MLDVAVAYNRFKFLGEEFLTWLWFVIDQDPAPGTAAPAAVGCPIAVEALRDFLQAALSANGQPSSHRICLAHGIDAEKTETPGALRSGLSRPLPSTVTGPRLLKLAI